MASVAELGREVLPVPAESCVVQAALGCQVPPSVPCDFAVDCRIGQKDAQVQG